MIKIDFLKSFVNQIKQFYTLYISILLLTFAIGIDGPIFPFLLDKYNIRYLVMGFMFSISHIAALSAGSIAFLGINPLRLYLITIVTYCLSYFSLFTTYFTNSVLIVVALIIISEFLISFAYRIQTISVHSILVELSRLKSFSISIYETIQFTMLVIAPLFTPLILMFFKDPSISYTIPLLLCMLGSIPILYPGFSFKISKSTYEKEIDF